MSRDQFCVSFQELILLVSVENLLGVFQLSLPILKSEENSGKEKQFKTQTQAIREREFPVSP